MLNRENIQLNKLLIIQLHKTKSFYWSYMKNMKLSLFKRRMALIN